MLPEGIFNKLFYRNRREDNIAHTISHTFVTKIDDVIVVHSLNTHLFDVFQYQVVVEAHLIIAMRVITHHKLHTFGDHESHDVILRIWGIPTFSDGCRVQFDSKIINDNEIHSFFNNRPHIMPIPLYINIELLL